MAKKLIFTTVNSVTASNTFRPRTDFVVVAAKETALTGTYKIQVKPPGTPSTVPWTDFPMEPSSFTSNTKVIAVEGSPGFDYRLLLTTAVGTLDDVMYWDHITQLQAFVND